MRSWFFAAAVFVFSVAFSVASSVATADEAKYQVPPAAVARFVDAPPIPSASLGPDRATLLLVTAHAYPSIAEVAEAELRLAGVRVNPRSYSAARRSYSAKLELLEVRRPGTPRPISGIAPEARLADIAWSPDGKQIAFTVTSADTVMLWLAEVATASARALSPTPLNSVLGRPCTWLPDSTGLLCRSVPVGTRPPAPSSDAVPAGPIVQVNDGTKKPARTNPDLLTSPGDERLFEHFLTSQLVVIGVDGKALPLGKPGLYRTANPSPDGKHVLVEQLHRPFSYRVPISAFPLRSEIWSRSGVPEKPIADLGLAEDVTVDFDAVRTGRRELHWRADAAATLCWAEALDGGDPKQPAALRDRVECWAVPFSGRPIPLASLGLRYAGVRWGSGEVALIEERWWKSRKRRTTVVAPDRPANKPRVLWDRSSEDRYTDPGEPMMRSTPAGTSVLQLTAAGRLLLHGRGASEQGDRPFFDRLDLATGKSERLWRSDGQTLARVADVLDDDGDQVIVSRESVTEPPQLYTHAFADKRERQLTRFSHPVPELAKVKKQLLKWKRKDGLELSGMLYLPPGFRPRQDAPLPVLVWVYPQEFKTASAAGQVGDSPFRFVAPSWGGPLFALTQGYAVVDNPAFAIVGEGKTEPNDTYVEQLTADAASLIDAVVALGVGDRDRFAVGGHSYGAFTTANLLAHTELFRAGIARSGAYNRTLTPFGFQAEERTFWEAAETYDRMSPFRVANRIGEPLLLVHGMADNNDGTFPIQSERLFAALRGLGGLARYVQLPAEAHGYRARESVLHVLWEQVRWLDEHVKRARRR